MQHNGFKSSLSLTDATMLVAGNMVGSGIFIVSSDMSRDVGGGGWLLLLWLLTGLPLTLAAPIIGLQYGLPLDALGLLILSGAMAWSAT